MTITSAVWPDVTAEVAPEHSTGPYRAERALREQELNYHKKQKFSWLSESTDEVHLESPCSGKTTH